jgi:aryl-phospho-beta-D-glucosidase BglC (GH1 family)
MGGVNYPSIQAAVNVVPMVTTINVDGSTGVCNENVLIPNVTLRLILSGTNGATIHGENTSPTVDARVKGFMLQGFTITGGSRGIHLQRNANAIIDSVTVQNTGGDGILIDSMALGVVTNSTIQGNLGAGIKVAELASGRIGVNLPEDGAASAPNTISNNSGDGILVSSKATAQIIQNDISGNGGNGINVVASASANTAGNTINGNTLSGLAVSGRSYVNLGVLDGGADPDTTTSSNGQYGVTCTSGAVISGNLSNASPLAGRISQFGPGVNAFDSTCPTAPGTISLSTSTYRVDQLGAYIVITVNRTGGQAGAIAVNYSTSDDTAIAVTDYTAQSGTLQWANWDTTPKRFAVPVSNTTPFSGTKSFKVAISGANGGATLGLPASGTVTISGSIGTVLSIKVSGNQLVDANGKTVQLRGVHVSGLEYSLALLTASNPWGNATGDPTPNWNTIKTWGVNAVRVPLNEASWLGLSCIDEGGFGYEVVNGVTQHNPPGTTINADPGGNYRATVAQSVADATAAGLYVILDLHWTAPGNACPMIQNAMADADHAITFWTSLAETFKSSPNVIFELFNEPFLNATQSALVDSTPWADMLNGDGTLSAYLTDGTPAVISYTWRNAGYQQMLNAVRATGATNVVLTGTLGYSQFLDSWLQWKPTDPAGQLGASWHVYPYPGSPTEISCAPEPVCAAQVTTAAHLIRIAGYPVVITEFGDAIGGTIPPMVSSLLPFADVNGINYFGYAWDVVPNGDVLITDAAGTPTNGFGSYVKQHYLCVAAGATVCQ